MTAKRLRSTCRPKGMTCDAGPLQVRCNVLGDFLMGKAITHNPPESKRKGPLGARLSSARSELQAVEPGPGGPGNMETGSVPSVPSRAEWTWLPNLSQD